MSEYEIAWATGFFEGDGCISLRRNRTIILSAGQVHIERLERLQAALGVGYIHGPFQRHGKYRTQPIYRWQAASKEHVRIAMNLMWPYLGPTSKERLRILLAKRR